MVDFIPWFEETNENQEIGIQQIKMNSYRRSYLPYDGQNGMENMIFILCGTVLKAAKQGN